MAKIDGYLSDVVDSVKVAIIHDEAIFKANGKVHKRKMQTEYVANHSPVWVRFNNVNLLINDSKLDVERVSAVSNAWFD